MERPSFVGSCVNEADGPGILSGRAGLNIPRIGGARRRSVRRTAGARRSVNESHCARLDAVFVHRGVWQKSCRTSTLGEKCCQIAGRRNATLSNDAGNQSRRRNVKRRIGHHGALINDSHAANFSVRADSDELTNLIACTLFDKHIGRVMQRPVDGRRRNCRIKRHMLSCAASAFR